jgi:hypothetical protein
MQVARCKQASFFRETWWEDFPMYGSAASSTAKTGWLTVLSTLTCSVLGIGAVVLGTLPLLFLLMLLATTSAARTDSLVWAGTILLGSLVTGGWLLAAYGWRHSRIALNAVIILAIVWASLMVYFGWNVVTGVPHGRLDLQPTTIALIFCTVHASRSRSSKPCFE